MAFLGSQAAPTFGFLLGAVFFAGGYGGAWSSAVCSAHLGGFFSGPEIFVFCWLFEGWMVWPQVGAWYGRDFLASDLEVG